MIPADPAEESSGVEVQSSLRFAIIVCNNYRPSWARDRRGRGRSLEIGRAILQESFIEESRKESLEDAGRRKRAGLVVGAGDWPARALQVFHDALASGAGIFQGSSRGCDLFTSLTDNPTRWHPAERIADYNSVSFNGGSHST